MIPIQQTFEEHMTHGDIDALIQEHKIITLPLAYMRGVSFKKAFVLLDEAQNTTVSQMHLFLTRIGDGSKMVVTGDPYQSDLNFSPNGFNDARDRLKDLPGVSLVELDETSVRHPIINGIDSRYKKQKE